MPVLLSVFFGFAPMLLFAWFIYWLDRYEKEPKVLLGGVFLWGAVVAAGGAFIVNTMLGLGVYLFTNSETATDITTTSLIAPIVEETLKGFAVLIVFLLVRQEFDSLLDGVVYAAVTALGFAATENAYYIYTFGYQDGGWMGFFSLVFVRVILVGWQHPFYTAFIGIGLAITRMSRSPALKLAPPVLGWSLAVYTHAVHNILATVLPGAFSLVFGTLLDWTGWFFMFLFILWATAQDRRTAEKYLREEVSQGIITVDHYRVATSSWIQSIVRLNALFSGRYRITNRFYQVCSELAHKKHQLQVHGDEGGNRAIIEKLRSELSRLAPYAINK